MMFFVPLVGCISVISVGANFALTNSRGVEYPTTRFDVWENLDPKRQEAAASMGYDEMQWNSPGTFSLEYSRYDLLSDTSWAALDDLKIESEEWDCFVNHYRGYSWSEMEMQGIAGYYGTFGYNQTRWEQEAGFVAQVDSRLWDELAPNEQAAAGELCYFEQLWNGVQIRFWTETQAPTFVSSVISTTNSPSQATTVSPSVSLATPPPSVALTALPTVFPTATISTTPTSVPMIPAFPTDIDPVDSIRYVPWELHSDEFQVLAASLGYEMESWNLPGTAQIEYFNFASLRTEDMATVNAMGLTEAQWNCYINHYQGFAWDEIPDDTIVHLETIGWYGELWENGKAYPETRNRAWFDLDSSEREAAVALCYRYETWDVIDLKDWNLSESPSMVPNESLSSAPSILLDEPVSAVPVASQSPTVSSPAPAAAMPMTAPSSNGIPLPTMTIFWEGTAQPIDSRAFERSMVDYLTAFLVFAAPSPVSSVDATVVVEDEQGASVTGQVTFEDNSSKVSQPDLEELLIGHFSSAGTEGLYKYLIAKGFDIEEPMRVEVGGYDTSRASPVQSREEEENDNDLLWGMVIVAAIVVIATAAAGFLIHTNRRTPKTNIPDHKTTTTPAFESFRASTTIVNRSETLSPSSSSKKQELDKDDYSVDQSLYTTDTYLQAVR